MPYAYHCAQTRAYRTDLGLASRGAKIDPRLRGRQSDVQQSAAGSLAATGINPVAAALLLSLTGNSRGRGGLNFRPPLPYYAPTTPLTQPIVPVVSAQRRPGGERVTLGYAISGTAR